MKIVHVMNWYIPGMGYQENFLPFEQSKLGNEVIILTSDRYPQFRGFERHIGRILGSRTVENGTSEIDGVKIQRLRTIFEYGRGRVLVLEDLCHELQLLSPDIVHCHGTFTLSTLQATLAQKSAGYKLFIDDHSHQGNFDISGFHKRAYVALLVALYRIFSERITGWMPVTESAERILLATARVPKEKITLLPLGVDTSRFRRSDVLRTETRMEMDLDTADIAVLTSGKFDNTKETVCLIEAIASLRMKEAGVHLVLVGDGPESYMNKIANAIKDGRLGNHVHRVGFVRNADLPRYYSAADIGVWPGNHSITVLEAAATGLPVIVPSNDIAYDCLLRPGAALGFRRGDPRSLANAILRLCDDPNLRRSISGKAVALVNEQLSWPRIASHSLKIYSRHLGGTNDIPAKI